MFCRSVQYCLPKITSYPVLLHVNKQELCSVKAPLLSKGLLSHELAAHPIIFKIVLCPGTLGIDALKFHFAMTGVYKNIFEKCVILFANIFKADLGSHCVS